MEHKSSDYTLKSLIPGAASTSVSVFLGYPIDTVKTRLQTGMYSSFTRCVIDTAKKEGVTSFYRGVAMPFSTLVVKRSIQFRIYEESKKHVNPWLAGTIASFVSPISNPMHVVKIKMQDSNRDKYKTMTDCVKDIYKTDGYRGFFKGTTVNFTKDVLFGTIYLGSYGTLKERLDTTPDIVARVPSKEVRNFLAGGTAGSFTWYILMPIDFVKTAYQSGRGKQFVIDRVRTHGVTHLWKGAVPTIARIFPINAIAMMTYEHIKTFLAGN